MPAVRDVNEVETSMLNRRSLIAAAIALAMPATLPALASAASVSADPAGAITLRDAGSETNAVTVTLDAPTRNWVIRDSATPLTAGAGCTQSTADEVRCAQAGARPTAYLGGGDDTFTAPDDGGWIVYGEAGSDRLAGGAGADTFFGGPGADTLTGAGGNDRLDGGTGDDTIDGGPGEDLITYTSATGPVTVDLTAGTGGQAGEHDVLTGIEDVTASGTLIGDDGPNFLTGGGGDDVISGNGGDDTLVGEAGSDTLDGGAGNDRLYGDTTFGDGEGADHLDGGDGNDIVNGGDGAGDQVSGGPGDDIVSGGGHQDADVMDGLTGDGPDQIDGGPGFDILDYGDRGSFDGARSLGVGVDLRHAAPQGEQGEGDSAIEVEGVYGGDGNDTLVGDDGDNVLHGGGGDDTLRGLGGADTLDGGAGVNLFDCGGSNDTVIAGPQDSRIACDGATAPPPGGSQSPPPGGGGPEPEPAAFARPPRHPPDGAPPRQDAAARPRRQDRAARERIVRRQDDDRPQARKGHLPAPVGHGQAGRLHAAPQALGEHDANAAQAREAHAEAVARHPPRQRGGEAGLSRRHSPTIRSRTSAGWERNGWWPASSSTTLVARPANSRCRSAGVPRSCAQTRYVEGTCCQAAERTGCSSTARLCQAVLSMACRWISGSQSCRNVPARVSGRTVNVPPSGSMSRNGAGSSPPNEERLCPTSGR